MIHEPVQPGASSATRPVPMNGGAAAKAAGRHVYFEPLHLQRDDAEPRPLQAHASLTVVDDAPVDLSRTYYADTPRRLELEAMVQQPGLREAIEKACRQSLDGSSGEMMERGGWIVRDNATGVLAYQPYRSAIRSTTGLDSLSRDVVRVASEGKTVEAFFHTHRNRRADGFDVIQSPDDVRAARLLGLPGIIGTRYGMVYFDGASAPGRTERGFYGPDRQASLSFESKVREAIGYWLLAGIRGLHRLIEKLPRW